jgi:hypothetical protein
LRPAGEIEAFLQRVRDLPPWLCSPSAGGRQAPVAADLVSDQAQSRVNAGAFVRCTLLMRVSGQRDVEETAGLAESA